MKFEYEYENPTLLCKLIVIPEPPGCISNSINTDYSLENSQVNSDIALPGAPKKPIRFAAGWVEFR